MSEEDALALVEASLREERAASEKFKLRMEAVKTAIEGIIALFAAGYVLAYFAGYVLAATAIKVLVIVGAIGLVVTALYYAIAYLAGLIFDLRHPIIQTVENLYPARVAP